MRGRSEKMKPKKPTEARPMRWAMNSALDYVIPNVLAAAHDKALKLLPMGSEMTAAFKEIARRLERMRL